MPGAIAPAGYSNALPLRHNAPKANWHINRGLCTSTQLKDWLLEALSLMQQFQEQHKQQLLSGFYFCKLR